MIGLPGQARPGTQSQSLGLCVFIKMSSGESKDKDKLTPPEGVTAVEWPKVVLFGSSTTQHCFSYDGGWGAMLADKLARRCDVISRGFGGYNSKWCRLVLPQLYPTSASAQGIVAFVIFLGSNDSTQETNRSHVSAHRFKKNLCNMVDHLESVGVSRDKVVLVGPQGIYYDTYKVTCLQKGWEASHSNASAEEYTRVCEKAAKRRSVEFINLFKAIQDYPDRRHMFTDGLHMSREGSRMLFDLLWPAIRERTLHLHMFFPVSARISQQYPEESIIPQPITKRKYDRSQNMRRASI